MYTHDTRWTVDLKELRQCESADSAETVVAFSNISEITIGLPMVVHYMQRACPDKSLL